MIPTKQTHNGVNSFFNQNCIQGNRETGVTSTMIKDYMKTDIRMIKKSSGESNCLHN